MVGLVIALNCPVLYLVSLGNSKVSICCCADMELGEEHFSEFQSREASNSHALLLGRGLVKDESRTWSLGFSFPNRNHLFTLHYVETNTKALLHQGVNRTLILCISRI